MASLAGFKFLQRNVGFRSAAKFSQPKRLPRRILYYSRFANQLNFLRNNEKSVNLDKNLFDEDLLDYNKNLDSLFSMRETPIEDEIKDFNELNIDQKKNKDRSSKQFDPKNYFFSHLEFAENNYIYNHVHKRLNVFANMGQMVDNLPVYNQIKHLEKLISSKESMSPEEYKNSIDVTSKSIKSFINYMNQQELAILLTAIKDKKSDEFLNIKCMIDIELRWLLKTHVRTRLMDLDLWFYLADTFYECLLKSTFVNVLVTYMAKDKEIFMSNKQFLHLLFLIILQRNHYGILSIYEEKILQVLKRASFEDTATICMAYFKTKTIIKNSSILKMIIDNTSESLANIDPKEPGYCAVIKSIRYSSNIDCRRDVSHLVLTLTEDPDNKIVLSSPYNMVHTIKLMESFRIYDRKLLDLLYENMFFNEDNFRIKDLQYSLTSLSNFSYKDLKLDISMIKNFDKLSNDVVSEIREDSHLHYPHLIPLLRAFTIFGYYNSGLIDYINKAMNEREKFYSLAKAFEFERSALLIYVASRLEAIEEFGKNLPLFKRISNSINRAGNIGSVRKDSSIQHLNFLLKNSSTVDYLVNSNLYRKISLALVSNQHLKDPIYKFNFQYTMPHQNFADLIITKNSKEPGSFDQDNLLPNRVPDGEKHCLLLATKKYDYVDNHQRLCGYKRLVKRLLEKLGYIVMEVDINEPKIDSLAKKIRTSLD